jgi:hypothetical protein
MDIPREYGAREDAVDECKRLWSDCLKDGGERLSLPSATAWWCYVCNCGIDLLKPTINDSVLPHLTPLFEPCLTTKSCKSW